MKKSKNLTLSLIAIASFSTSVFAEEKEVSINEELSQTRMEMTKQNLQNKLYETQLNGLQKKKEIQEAKNEIERLSLGVSVDKNIGKAQEKKDYTFKIDNNLNDEDFISSENNWKQSVGFIYEDDLKLGTEKSNDLNDTPIDSLVDNTADLDFESMLKDVTNEAKDGVPEELDSSKTLNNVNEFKLIGVELNKLNIYEDKKKARLKVNYITNNGYQKIRGSKIVNVVEGFEFNVKNKVDFKVDSISENGVQYTNVTDGTKGNASR